jgi:hypothetical protein
VLKHDVRIHQIKLAVIENREVVRDIPIERAKVIRRPLVHLYR